MNSTYTNIPKQNISKIVQTRLKAGRAAQLFFGNQFTPPAWITENFQDENFRHYHQAENDLSNEPIIRIHGAAVEFASRSLISPKYIHVLEGLAKTAKAKRERRQRLNERIERSKISRVKPAEPALGNTGSNLEKFEKITRERRYRIQRFIQKNRLPGQRKCTCGENHATVYDCKKCRRQGNTVCTCGQPISEYITISKNIEHGSVNTGGVATCGSVWACPVCRAKIVDQRSKELEQIYQEGKNKGWKFHLVTFTIPHYGSDNLAELYGSSSLGCGLSGAFTKFRSSYLYSKKFKKMAGLEFIGDIKSVEITYGQQNGFHPHIHFIIITKKDFDVQKWQEKFLGQWQKNCVQAGLKPPNERGVRIDQCEDAAMVVYLSKWSVGSELSSDSAKQAKGRNYSIAQLELMLIDERYRASTMDAFALDRVSGILSAYYKAMHGQKQLQFGNLQSGWRDEILGDEISDEQAAENEENEPETHLKIAVLEKSLYQEMKSAGKFTEFIEAIECIDANIAGYREITFQKARNMLHILGFEPAGLHHPGETLLSGKIQN